MGDLPVFLVLVGLIGAAGIALGILVGRRLGAWDERRAAAGDAAPEATRTGSAPDVDQPVPGGDAVD